MKRIGSFFLLLFLSAALFSANKNVHLYIQDMGQNPIRQIEKGVPFLLQVVVDNMSGVLQPEDIPGFENFQVTRYGSSQSTNIINGQRTDRIIFNYVLNAQNLGTFKLGPLLVQDKSGAQITSSSVQVVVGDATIAHSVKRQPYFLETQVNKKTLYIGEELLVKVRFYYTTEVENLSIVNPRFEGFSVGDVSSQPVEGVETVRGEEYHYQEWLITAYPEKIGTLMIPQIQAIFRVAADFSQGLRGIFDIFAMSSDKTVQAAARSVDVMPLPESKIYKNVSAVGQFEQATFALKQSKGEVGEGIVATCAVSGIGNFGMIKAPELHLPEGLRCYESNSSMREGEGEKQEKVFEYIIQADQPGDFIIPAQKFVYFDSIQKKYKTLSTNQTTLSIVGTSLIVQKSEAKEEGEKNTNKLPDSNLNYEFKDNEINYVLESSFEPHRTNLTLESMLSRSLWLLLLLSCLILFFWSYNTYVGTAWYETSCGYYFFVRWQLWRIIRKQDLLELYRLLQQICDHFHIDLHEQTLMDVFKKSNLSDVKLQEWKTFLQKLLLLVFSQQQDMKNKVQVLEQGKYWTLELLKAFRK